MQTHMRVLAVLQIVYASIGLLLAAFLVLVFGGIVTIVGFNAAIDESLVAIPILTFIGGLGAALLGIFSLPRLIAGIGLLYNRNWARVLTMIVSIIGLIDVPVGTALGIYGLWVTTRSESVELVKTAG
jgi:hypothetical protein